MVKGEPLPALSGRADDFAWPRPDAKLQPAPEPSAAPGSAPAAKPGAAGSPSASKPAAPAPGKKHAPAAAAPGEDGRRPLSLTDDRRRRTSPDNGLRPPVAGPRAPARGGRVHTRRTAARSRSRAGPRLPRPR